LSELELHDEGNIWGGAFWQLRIEIGKAPADKLLFATWKNFRTTDPMLFPKELLSKTPLSSPAPKASRFKPFSNSAD